jgi:hypothetical protein
LSQPIANRPANPPTRPRLLMNAIATAAEGVPEK